MDDRKQVFTFTGWLEKNALFKRGKKTGRQYISFSLLKDFSSYFQFDGRYLPLQVIVREPLSLNIRLKKALQKTTIVQVAGGLYPVYRNKFKNTDLIHFQCRVGEGGFIRLVKSPPKLKKRQIVASIQDSLTTFEKKKKHLMSCENNIFSEKKEYEAMNTVPFNTSTNKAKRETNAEYIERMKKTHPMNLIELREYRKRRDAKGRLYSSELKADREEKENDAIMEAIEIVQEGLEPNYYDD